MTREEIITAQPLVEYCEKRGLTLRREGHEWVCLCPLHEEHTPSFKINPEKRVFYCHGCDAGGSVIDLHMAWCGLSNGEAMRELSNGELGTGIKSSGGFDSVASPQVERKRVITRLPRALPWDRDMAQRVADSRGLHITAVEFGFLWLKTLRFCHFCNVECWMLGDRSNRCVEARRIDKGKFPSSINLQERKAHTFSGFSDKSWPVGVLPPGFEEEWLKKNVLHIVLVEGGPDYLAACQIIAESPKTDFDNVLPVAILGASNDIANDALTHFRERQTTIVAHGDNEGCDAAERWKGQIISAGGAAQVFYLNQEGADLCDVVAAGVTYDDIALFK
jgi:hypothetical protein